MRRSAHCRCSGRSLAPACWRTHWAALGRLLQRWQTCMQQVGLDVRAGRSASSPLLVLGALLVHAKLVLYVAQLVRTWLVLRVQLMHKVW